MVIKKFHSNLQPTKVSLYQYGFSNSQELAKGCKDGNTEIIEKAAKLMAGIIPEGSVLIPIPNSCGRAVTTLALCDAISKYGKHKVFDALYGKCRETKLYELKAQGKSVANVDFGYKVIEGVEIPNNAVLVDNVYDTGATYRAASAASGVKPIYVIGSSKNADIKVMSSVSVRGLW